MFINTLEKWEKFLKIIELVEYETQVISTRYVIRHAKSSDVDDGEVRTESRFASLLTRWIAANSSAPAN